MLVACVALFVALGGVGYAAATIDSGDIVNDSVRSKDVKNRALRGWDLRKNTLGGAQVKESKLAEVPSAAMLGGSPASACVKADARGLALAGATVKADGTLSTWFNRAGGAPTVSGGGAGNGHYVEFPGVSASTTTHVATADLIGLAGLVTADFSGEKLHTRTWDADADADTFDTSDRSYTVLLHASGTDG
jgi:hypothetical protein